MSDELDPVAIRITLQQQRENRVPFDQAWATATSDIAPGDNPSDTRDLLRFMRKHFEAAYYADASENGRCMVPPRDTSSALPVRDFTGDLAERNARIVQMRAQGLPYKEIAQVFGISTQRAQQIGSAVNLPKARKDEERCKSGDGCDRLATRGRYGRTFCERHGAELDRITGMVDGRLRKADPRNGGNTSLFTHRAA